LKKPPRLTGKILLTCGASTRKHTLLPSLHESVLDEMKIRVFDGGQLLRAASKISTHTASGAYFRRLKYAYGQGHFFLEENFAVDC
jgi:hypothetical protein